MYMLERGLEVEFPVSLLVRLFEDLKMEERVVKEMLRNGCFCEVSPFQAVSDQRLVLIQNSVGRSFLFTCLKKETTWQVISIEETCAGALHSNARVCGCHMGQARFGRVQYERLWGSGTTRTRCKVVIVTRRPKGEVGHVLSSFVVGSIGIEEASSFEGSGVDFLQRFVLLEKLDRVAYSTDARLAIELRLRGKAEPLRVIPISL